MSRINQIGFFVFLIFADQLSKYLIRHSSGFYICNTSIAFGLKIPEALFWIFWLAIIFSLIYKTYKFEYKIQDTMEYMLVLSGAFSNIIDRLYFGCIIDFIDFQIWPVFNLADVFISTGVILIIVKHTMQNKKYERS
jgi:signal peptidase II